MAARVYGEIVPVVITGLVPVISLVKAWRPSNRDGLNQFGHDMDYRSAAAILPPSTVVTSAVVFSCQRLMQEGLRHVVGGDFAAEQVAAHVILLGNAARLGALLDEIVGQQPGADAVGIDRIGADAVGAVVERVLPHQEQGRRFRQTIGAEIRPRVHRLLGGVEQQAAAGALREHDLDRGLRDALMAVEIQLEALPQHRFVDLADAALPGGAGIGDEDVDAAECGDDLVERGLDRCRRR